MTQNLLWTYWLQIQNTVKLGNKEWFDRELIGIKEPFPVTNLPFGIKEQF